MNDIVIRTSSSEYAGGSTIYGVVYLRLLEPVVADSITLQFTGKETCKWRRTLPKIATLSDRKRSDSQESGFSDGSTATENFSDNLTFKDVVFEGEKTHFEAFFPLAKFPDTSAIPLGCYAFPFQFALKQGLPNSFKKTFVQDDVKRAGYQGEVCYSIKAELKSSLSKSESDMKKSQEINLRDENFLQRRFDKVDKTVQQEVKSCCCFSKGVIILGVQLDKLMYTIGETINVKFSVENKSVVEVETVKITLTRTINLKGQMVDDGDRITSEAFVEIRHIEVPLHMEGQKRKVYEVPIPLPADDEETLSTTNGSIVTSRYWMEVEVIVPLDKVLSIIEKIEVYPSSMKSWNDWTPPEWAKNVRVQPVNRMCAVPRHILESTEFANIPLPMAGLPS